MPERRLSYQRSSSETVSFLRQWRRRAASTRRPFAVAILSRKPCLLTRLRREGWNVLFMIYIFYIFLDFSKRAAKIKFFPESRKYFFFYSSQPSRAPLFTALSSNTALSEDMLYGRETVTVRETSGMCFEQWAELAQKWTVTSPCKTFVTVSSNG